MACHTDRRGKNLLQNQAKISLASVGSVSVRPPRRGSLTTSLAAVPATTRSSISLSWLHRSSSAQRLYQCLNVCTFVGFVCTLCARVTLDKLLTFWFPLFITCFRDILRVFKVRSQEIHARTRLPFSFFRAHYRYTVSSKSS